MEEVETQAIGPQEHGFSTTSCCRERTSSFRATIGIQIALQKTPGAGNYPFSYAPFRLAPEACPEASQEAIGHQTSHLGGITASVFAALLP
mmetsp:Transcript_2936/g.6407  ORF Transcript_2936/g.6407 Transcript_2936/m.6407 type:complete len:91 (-) Transcript_2936:283-555(-)